MTIPFENPSARRAPLIRIRHSSQLLTRLSSRSFLVNNILKRAASLSDRTCRLFPSATKAGTKAAVVEFQAFVLSAQSPNGHGNRSQDQEVLGFPACKTRLVRRFWAMENEGLAQPKTLGRSNSLGIRRLLHNRRKIFPAFDFLRRCCGEL
jgi:hypothetical protein